MAQPSLASGAALLMLVLCPNTLRGQEERRGFDQEFLPRSVAVWQPVVVAAPRGPLPAQPEVQTSDGHNRRLAGFAGGVTVGALVGSLEAVVGEGSCTGSGDIYLQICQIVVVGGALVGGGVGALVGGSVRAEEPGGRGTRILVGSALGTAGAFLVSTVACQQGDAGFLCGSQGLVGSGAIVAGAVLGGVLGARPFGGSESVQVGHLGPVLGPGRPWGWGATLVWRPE